jgi:hypothetical protein
MMLNAPKVIVLFELPGDRGCWRKMKNRRHHRVDRTTQPWRPKQDIPPSQLERDRLRRQVEEFRKATHPQAMAALSQARMLRAA